MIDVIDISIRTMMLQADDMGNPFAETESFKQSHNFWAAIDDRDGVHNVTPEYFMAQLQYIICICNIFFEP